MRGCPGCPDIPSRDAQQRRVLFPLSARSPSRFGLGLSSRSCSRGKLAASPALLGARAPSDVVCPKRSPVGKRVVDTVVPDHQALLLPKSSRHPRFVPGCPVLPCLRPAVCRVRQMPLGVCIQRCGGRCWMAARLCQPPLPAPRAEDGLTPQPPAGLSSLVCSDWLPVASSQPCRSSANPTFPHC